MKEFFKTNVGKTLIAGAYLAASAFASYLVTATTSEPELFGPLTAVINLAAVFLVKTFSSKTPNVGEK